MIPKLMRLGAPLLLGVLLSTGAIAQVKSNGNGGYLFRLKLTKGEKIRFQVPVSIENLAGQPPIHPFFTLAISVLSVSGDGVSTIRGKFSSSKVNGATLLPDRTGEFKVNQRGKVLSNDSGPLGFCVLYPAEAIKIGDTFSAPVPVAIGNSLSGGVGSAQAKFKFLGFTQIGTRRLARLTFKVAGNLAPSGSILVGVTDGLIEKYYTRFAMNQVESGSSEKPITVTAILKRAP